LEQETRFSATADAAHHMAIKAAEGDGLLQDWAAALDHLQHSAQLGSRLAQAELAALSPAMGAGARHPCGRSGPGLSVAAVPQRHRSRELAAAAEHVEHFGKGPDCCCSGHRHIGNVRLADREGSPGLTSAQIYDGKEGRHRSGSGRTNAVCAFPGPDRDLILAIVRARVADATSDGNPHILHYSVGEEFRPHFDTPENPNSPGFRQRVLTFLISLNDDYKGGKTEFPVIAAGGRGERAAHSSSGTWNPTKPSTGGRCTRGRSMTRGEKWLLSQWIGPSAEGRRPVLLVSRPGSQWLPLRCRCIRGECVYRPLPAGAVGFALYPGA
jgi:hypothetical protein